MTTNTTQRVSVGLNATEGKLRYQLGAAWQRMDLRSDNYTDGSRTTPHYSNWFPRASLIYSLSHSSNLSIGYQGVSTAPTIDQLQPLPDLTNPYVVKLGNPKLGQEFDHTLNGTVKSFNGHSGQNWQLALQGTLAENKITAATTLLPGAIQQIQYVNVNGTGHGSASLTYGFPLGRKVGNGSWNAHASLGRDISLLNGAEDVTTATGWGSKLKFNTHPAPKLFLDATAAVNYTGAHYSLRTSPSTHTWLQNYNVEVSLEFPLALTVTSSCNLQVTGPHGSLPGSQTNLWNAAVYKTIFRSAQLRLSVFDLLGTKANYTQTVGINYLSTQRSNLPGRIWLLSFVYHFRKF